MKTTHNENALLPRQWINYAFVGVVFFALCWCNVVHAQSGWTNMGQVNGIQVYRDNSTGLEWTVTIGQVQSSGWGAPARSLVAKYGFRLPSFRELQVMEGNGGFRYLNINTKAFQYYETSDSNILAAGFGNGFRTPQQRQGTGTNWVIGVRSGQSSGGGQSGGGQSGGQTVVTGNQSGGKIRVLIILGTKDKSVAFQGALKVSRQNIDGLIQGSQLSKEKGEVFFLEGDQATRNNILSTTRRLCQEAGYNGAVLVYYFGHGATYASQAGKKIHYITPMADDEGETGQPIARTDIYDILDNGNTRFAGLITDACSNVIETEVAREPVFDLMPRAMMAPDPKTISPLRALLLYGRGTIDMNSSDPNREGPEGEGQIAFITNEGSFFTKNFTSIFAIPSITRSSFSKQDFIEKLDQVQKGLNQLVEERKKRDPGARTQGSQDIYVFQNTLR